MKNKKVLILHNILAPYRLPLFEEISKKYNLEVIFCKENSKDRLWTTSLDKYTFKHKILKNISLKGFVINFGLIKYLVKQNFDCYILAKSSESFLSLLTCCFFAKLKRKPIFIWTGEKEENYKSRNKMGKVIKSLKKIYLRLLLNISTGFLCYSLKSKEFMKSLNNKKTIFVGTQIMPKCLLPELKKILKPVKWKNKKIILHLGYLRKDKGIQYLIQAFNRLNQKDVLLLIVGDGEYKNELRKLAKENNNIKFFDYAEGIEKANFYSMADFFVFPTLDDAWGFVINESLYYNVPIITTNAAAGCELINENKTGLTINPESKKEIHLAIKKLLNDPKLLLDMKKNIKKIPPKKIVDIKTSAKTFNNAINFGLKINKTHTK
ncbi:glycosyltransferase family 4 protein [Candidatus Pacearchaeota archaeon]|nr:glycosyltransferase family 4 protein [Candidatus Pacearchaeota archaeon]